MLGKATIICVDNLHNIHRKLQLTDDPEQSFHNILFPDK